MATVRVWTTIRSPSNHSRQRANHGALVVAGAGTPSARAAVHLR